MAAATTTTPTATTTTPTAVRPAEGDLGTVARLGAAKAKFKNAARILTTERDAARTELAKLQAENAELKAKADTSVTAKRVTELEAQIRTGNHRAAFARAAAAKGVAPEAVDDLWNLSGYKAEKDTVDEAALAALIDEQKAKRAYLFAPKPTDGQAGNLTEALRPGPASGQGGNQSSGNGKLQVSKAQLRDPMWMQANAKALGAGNFELI